MKGLFKTMDFSFCNNKECNKQNSCKRNIKHYPQWREYTLSYILIEDWEQCEYFLDNKKEMK